MSSNPKDVLAFLHLVENLKRTKRTGWIECNIQGPESIADHMYRMGVMAMLVNDPTLDQARCVKIAIVHDLAEAIVGDITPHSPIPKEEKHRLELEAMEKISRDLGDTPLSKEMFALWQEYEEAKTPEALLVKDLDKFELIVQAMEYEKSDNVELDSFFDNTEGKFKHPQVQTWVEALKEERRAHQDSKK